MQKIKICHKSIQTNDWLFLAHTQPIAKTDSSKKIVKLLKITPKMEIRIFIFCMAQPTYGFFTCFWPDTIDNNGRERSVILAATDTHTKIQYELQKFKKQNENMKRAKKGHSQPLGQLEGHCVVSIAKSKPMLLPPTSWQWCKIIFLQHIKTLLSKCKKQTLKLK